MALTELRRARGESRAETAQAVGVDPSTIWRIETGKTAGSTPVLLALAQHFGVSVEDLFEDSAA